MPSADHERARVGRRAIDQHEDYVFWLEQVRRAGKAVRVESPEPLAWYLVRERSLSANKLQAASWQWDIYRSVAKLGMVHSAFCMARYVRHAVIKRKGVDRFRPSPE